MLYTAILRQDEERFTVIKNVRAPYSEVGKLESVWTPLVRGADGRTVDPMEDESCGADLPEIDTPKVRCNLLRSLSRKYVLP